MPYLNLEMEKPVRVTWDGFFPQYDPSKQYPKHEYNVEVDGQWMTFGATEKTHNDIQKFCQMNGKEFAIVKVPYTKFKHDGFVYNIVPWDITNSTQNADMYGQTGSQYAKQEDPQQKPDDPAFLGMCANQAALLLAHSRIGEDDLESTANMFYGIWKNWKPKIETSEKTQVTRSVANVKPMPLKEEEPPMPEEPPPTDKGFIGDTSLPF